MRRTSWNVRKNLDPFHLQPPTVTGPAGAVFTEDTVVVFDTDQSSAKVGRLERLDTSA